jgi:hypothetical protein
MESAVVFSAFCNSCDVFTNCACACANAIVLSLVLPPNKTFTNSDILSPNGKFAINVPSPVPIAAPIAEPIGPPKNCPIAAPTNAPPVLKLLAASRSYCFPAISPAFWTSPFSVAFFNCVS